MNFLTLYAFTRLRKTVFSIDHNEMQMFNSFYVFRFLLNDIVFLHTPAMKPHTYRGVLDIIYGFEKKRK